MANVEHASRTMQDNRNTGHPHRGEAKRKEVIIAEASAGSKQSIHIESRFDLQ